MFRKFNALLLVTLVAVLLSKNGSAQNNISQPYSGYGIGIINNSSNGVLDGLSGTSYAIQDPYFINFRNPASYAAFDSLSFVADAAASIYSSTLTQGTQTQKNTYARAGYLTIGLPVTRHWRTSVGIIPFSSIGYAIQDSRNIDSIGKVTYDYSGHGGLNQLYWGNAFRICKGLSIGLNASYLFGSIYNTSNTAFDGSNFYNTIINDAYHIDGIYLTAGLQYFFNIKENHRIGIGATYSNTAYIWAKEDLLINYYTGIYSSVTTYDTVLHDSQLRGNLNIPQSVGGGLSYTYKNKLMVAADVTWQNWNQYQFMNHGDSLTDAIITSAGIQYIPDPLSNKFFKKMAFRLGAKYSTGNLFLNNKLIDEFSVSLGIGIPLATFNTHSTINLVFEYGKMGTLVNDMIKQNYFRFTFNFTLQEKWYQRVKIE
ncbi:MAG: hypothetical protein MJZ57_04740 [Bacteroidales bacterium]|nr:hypothetical protein [Bacteroidales bacterium]